MAVFEGKNAKLSANRGPAFNVLRWSITWSVSPAEKSAPGISTAAVGWSVKCRFLLAYALESLRRKLRGATRAKRERALKRWMSGPKWR